MPLKPKHASFLKAYLSNGHNSAAAARSAGYSERSAPQTGSALLKRPDIAAQLELAQGKTEKTLALTFERVMSELATIALFDPQEMYDQTTGKLLPVSKMPESARRALSAVEESPAFTKLKTNNKIAAIEMVCKLSGWLKQEINTAPVQILIAPSLQTFVDPAEKKEIKPVWE